MVLPTLVLLGIGFLGSVPHVLTHTHNSCMGIQSTATYNQIDLGPQPPKSTNCTSLSLLLVFGALKSPDLSCDESAGGARQSGDCPYGRRVVRHESGLGNDVTGECVVQTDIFGILQGYTEIG